MEVQVQVRALGSEPASVGLSAGLGRVQLCRSVGPLLVVCSPSYTVTGKAKKSIRPATRFAPHKAPLAARWSLSNREVFRPPLAF